ncbi:MAG: CpsB/CapC family capsule biosynthesis tyrosine phosphatase [Bacteroidota bacterium]
MISFFRKKTKDTGIASSVGALSVDMHSHILPGLDDGAETMAQSLELIRSLKKLGFKKLIATPHIMGDFYKNTPATISTALQKVNDAVKEQGIDIKIEAAAEYYLDEWFIEMLKSDQPLLSFGGSSGIRYLLFEISYINPAPQLAEAVFLMRAAGYRPVLAHPERYLYMYEDFAKLKDLHENGVLFQVNSNSLTGYYSKVSQLLAEKLIENRMVSFLGSDCHARRHIDVLTQAQGQKYYQKALKLDLLNNSLNA